MKGLHCPRCGAINPVRAVFAGMTGIDPNVLPIRCRACGERSSLLRTLGGHLAFFATFAAAFLALFLGAQVLFQQNELIWYAIAAVVLPMLALPPAWAWLFLRSEPAPGVPPPGDLAPGRKLVFFTVGLATAVMLILAGISVQVAMVLFSRPPADPRAAVVESLADDVSSWRCRTVAGEEIALGDLRDEAVFLNVWATWCGPCVREMPSIAALQRAAAGTGVRFLLVSQEHGEVVERFARGQSLELPFASGPPLPAQLRTAAIPATFVLHRGRIVYRHVGAADWNDAKFREWLLALR